MSGTILKLDVFLVNYESIVSEWLPIPSAQSKNNECSVYENMFLAAIFEKHYNL